MCISNDSLWKYGCAMLVFTVLYSIGVAIYAALSSVYLAPVGSNYSLKGLMYLQYFISTTTILISTVGFFGFYNSGRTLVIYFITAIIILSLGIIACSTVFIVLSVEKSSYLYLPNQLTCQPITIEHNPFTQYRQMTYPIDVFLSFVDQELCSENCPCNLTDNYNDASPIKDLSERKEWRLSNSGVVNFQRCPIDSEVVVVANSKLNGFIVEDPNEIYEYYKLLENKFECVGFCTRSYFDYNNRLTFFSKFLFTDINRGLPKHYGCFEPLLKWLKDFFRLLGILNILELTLFALDLLIAIKFSSYLRSTNLVENSTGASSEINIKYIPKPNFDKTKDNHSSIIVTTNNRIQLN